MCRLQLKRLHLITPKKDIKPYIFIFKRSLFTMHLLNALNSLNTYLINSWTWIACLNIAVCLCPLLYVDLHIVSSTLLCGERESIQSLWERRRDVGFPRWHGEEKQMVGLKQREQSEYDPRLHWQKLMWGNRIQTGIFALKRPHRWLGG